eukprot:3803670-Pleurochrysis_carterae.AAC.1
MAPAPPRRGEFMSASRLSAVAARAVRSAFHSAEESKCGRCVACGGGRRRRPCGSRGGTTLIEMATAEVLSGCWPGSPSACSDEAEKFQEAWEGAWEGAGDDRAAFDPLDVESRSFSELARADACPPLLADDTSRFCVSREPLFAAPCCCVPASELLDAAEDERAGAREDECAGERAGECEVECVAACAFVRVDGSAAAPVETRVRESVRALSSGLRCVFRIGDGSAGGIGSRASSGVSRASIAAAVRNSSICALSGTYPPSTAATILSTSAESFSPIGSVFGGAPCGGPWLNIT